MECGFERLGGGSEQWKLVSFCEARLCPYLRTAAGRWHMVTTRAQPGHVPSLDTALQQGDDPVDAISTLSPYVG